MPPHLLGPFATCGERNAGPGGPCSALVARRTRSGRTFLTADAHTHHGTPRTHAIQIPGCRVWALEFFFLIPEVISSVEPGLRTPELDSRL